MSNPRRDITPATEALETSLQFRWIFPEAANALN